MSIIYLDTETTGLDPSRHEVWEIAFALDGAPIKSNKVIHHGMTADPEALTIGNYADRGGETPTALSAMFEHILIGQLTGRTLCGANPAFDAAFLSARWGVSPWKYRLLDIEAYAMPALGYDVPQGLNTIAKDLRALGHDIPEPDHTAAGDVATVRECHWALQSLYAHILPPIPHTDPPANEPQPEGTTSSTEQPTT